MSYPLHIVIPVYQKRLSNIEIITINRALLLLGKTPISIIGPKSLDIRHLKKQLENDGFTFHLFDDHFFKDVVGYNRLMLSVQFYQCFSDSLYVLIYQTDAMIMDDHVAKFIQTSLDYIGAPWISDEHTSSSVKYAMQQALSTCKTKAGQYLKRMSWNRKGYFPESNRWTGNGGLSLRKVSSHLRILEKFPQIASNWELNEDGFWGMFAPLADADFNTATREQALQFSFDANPWDCLELNNGQLPMGCHAWYREDGDYKGNREFWRRHSPLLANILNQNE